MSSGLTGLSCTDEQRQWNKGTQRNLEPKPLRDIQFTHHKVSDTFGQGLRSRMNPLPPTPIFHTHEQLNLAFKNQAFHRSTLLFKCVNANPTVPPIDPHTPTISHTNHDGTMSCPGCLSFYDTFVAIDDKRLEEATREQSMSQLWHDSRKLRVTASSAKKVPVRTSPDAFLKAHVYPRFHGSAATKHGVVSEGQAVKWLEEQGHTVTRRGTILCPGEPWLSASPDGIMESGVLLEIKCPFLKDDETITDLMERGKYDVKLVDGVPQLQENGSRGFFVQIQLTMLCAGLRACKLLIWSSSQQVVVDVPFNKDFCSKIVARLKIFYFTYLLPYVAVEHQEGRLVLCARYAQGLCAGLPQT